MQYVFLPKSDSSILQLSETVMQKLRASTQFSRDKATDSNLKSLRTSPEYYPAGPTSPCSSSPQAHSVQLYCPFLRRWIPVVIQFSVRAEDLQVIMSLCTARSVGSKSGNSPRKGSSTSPSQEGQQKDKHMDAQNMLDEELSQRRGGKVYVGKSGDNDNMNHGNNIVRREVCVFSLAPRVALRHLSPDFRSELCLSPLDPDQQTYRSTDHPSPRHTGGSVDARSALSVVSEDCGSSCGNSLTGIETVVGKLERISTQVPYGENPIAPPLSPSRKTIGPDELLKPQNQRNSIGLPPRALFFGSSLYSNSRLVSNSAEVLDILVECDSFPFLAEDFSFPSSEEVLQPGETGGRLTKFLNFFSSGLRSGKNSGRSNTERSRIARGAPQESTTESLNSAGAGLSLGAKTSSGRLETEENSVLLTPALGSRSSSLNRWRSRCFPPSPQLASKAKPSFDVSSTSSALRKLCSSRRHIVLRCASASEFFRLLQKYMIACDKMDRLKVSNSPSLVCTEPSVDLTDIPSAMDDEYDGDMISNISRDPSATPHRRREESNQHTPLLPPGHDNQPPLPSTWMEFIRHTHNPQNGLRYAAIPPLFWNSMLDFAPLELYTFQSGVLVVEPLTSWKGPYTLAQAPLSGKRKSKKSHLHEANRAGSEKKYSDASRSKLHKEPYKEVKLELVSPPPHTVQSVHILSPLLASKEYEAVVSHSKENQAGQYADGANIEDTAVEEDTYLTYRHIFACVTANSLLFINTFGAIKLQIPLTDIRVIMFSERDEDDTTTNSSSPASWNSGRVSPTGKIKSSAVLPFCTFIIRDNGHDASHEQDFALTLTFLPPFDCSTVTSGDQPTPCSSVSAPNSPLLKRNAVKQNALELSEGTNRQDASVMFTSKETFISDERVTLYNSLSTFIRIMSALLPQTVTVHNNCASLSDLPVPEVSMTSETVHIENFDDNRNRGSDCGITANLLKTYPFCNGASGGTSASVSRASLSQHKGVGKNNFAGSALSSTPVDSSSPQDLVYANMAKSTAERRDFLKSSCCLVPIHLTAGIESVRSASFGYLKRPKVHHRFQETIRSQGVLEMALSMRMAARCQLVEQLKEDANADFTRHASALTSEITSPLTSGVIGEDCEEGKGKREIHDGRTVWRKEFDESQRCSRRPSQALRGGISCSPPNSALMPEEEFVPIRPVKKQSKIIRVKKTVD